MSSTDDRHGDEQTDTRLAAEYAKNHPADKDVERACAWADYRKDYGIPGPHMTTAHKAFKAGWKAAREGDQSEALR